MAKGSKVVIPPEIFRTVFDGWQHHQCLDLSYEAVDGKSSRYRVEPHVLAFYEGNWYVKAVVVEKNGVRISAVGRGTFVFALHRIKTAELLEREFDPDPGIIDAVNKKGLFDFPQVSDIRLQLSMEAVKFVGEQFEYVVEKRDKDGVIVRIPSAPAYRVINFVLVEGGGAKLLNHAELQQEVIRRAQKCIEFQQKG